MNNDYGGAALPERQDSFFLTVKFKYPALKIRNIEVSHRNSASSLATNNYAFNAAASLPQQYLSGQIKPLYELGKLQDAKPQPWQDVAEDPQGQQYEL